MQKYAEYKSSGIQWIGDIPSHWEVKKMNYICSQITDFVASGSFADLKNNVEYLDEPDYAMLVRTADLSCKGNIPPVYVSKESYAFLSNSNLFGGEIILPNIGSVGDVYLVPHDLYPYMTLAPNAIMVNTQCNKFFYYFFSSKCGRDGLADISQGTTQSKFNKTQLRALKVIVPSLVEQEAIVEYLDEKCGSIDSIIATQERRIALLSELKQSIITEAVTRGINPDAPIKDSGIEWIGEIPKHWEIKRLRFICEFRNGYTPSKLNADFWTDGTIPWYRMEDIRDSGRFLKDAKQYVTKEAVKGAGMFDAGSFILATTATIGEHAMLIVDSLANQRFTNLKIRKSLASSVRGNFFFYYLFLIDDFCKTSTRTATFPAMNMEDLRNCGVAIPPVEEQEAIVEYLDRKCESIDAAIGKAKREIELLREFKQSVITEAVTGKIKVY